ncbi:MAG: hypothetical protein NT171_16610 [Planctomycetota bacterium]|nr:hypothetical protein [Planctomycetota bacterium]
MSIPFPTRCPYCAFTIDGLTGMGTSSFQSRKDQQHRDLLFGRSVNLYGKQFNASFDFYGNAELPDVIRFAISYGDRTTVMSTHGNHPTLLIVSYIPAVIGSGNSIYSPGNLPCSGICLMSSASMNYSHSFPVLDDYVRSMFNGLSGACHACGVTTGFAQPFCSTCYQRQSFDWKKWL